MIDRLSPRTCAQDARRDVVTSRRRRSPVLAMLGVLVLVGFEALLRGFDHDLAAPHELRLTREARIRAHVETEVEAIRFSVFLLGEVLRAREHVDVARRARTIPAARVADRGPGVLRRFEDRRALRDLDREVAVVSVRAEHDARHGCFLPRLRRERV